MLGPCNGVGLRFCSREHCRRFVFIAVDETDARERLTLGRGALQSLFGATGKERRPSHIPQKIGRIHIRHIPIGHVEVNIFSVCGLHRRRHDLADDGKRQFLRFTEPCNDKTPIPEAFRVVNDRHVSGARFEFTGVRQGLQNRAILGSGFRSRRQFTSFPAGINPEHQRVTRHRRRFRLLRRHRPSF